MTPLRLVVLLFILFVSKGMDAQDPNLPDRDWYLDYATVDGVTREPPFPGFEAIFCILGILF